jgi:hypothetical protein
MQKVRLRLRFAQVTARQPSPSGIRFRLGRRIRLAGELGLDRLAAGWRRGPSVWSARSDWSHVVGQYLSTAEPT